MSRTISPCFILCRGNGKFVELDGTKTLRATGLTPENRSSFSVRFDGKKLKITSRSSGHQVTAIGRDWVLRAIPPQDPSWGEFEIEEPKDRQGYVHIKSVNPEAASVPYVSVIDKPRVVRIAEGAPRDYWSDSMLFSPVGGVF